MSDIALRDSLGFMDGYISEDSKWIIGDLGETKPCPSCPAATLPAWMFAIIGSNETCFSQEIASKIVSVKASSNGASDGWYYMERLTQ